MNIVRIGCKTDFEKKNTWPMRQSTTRAWLLYMGNERRVTLLFLSFPLTDCWMNLSLLEALEPIGSHGLGSGLGVCRRVNMLP